MAAVAGSYFVCNTGKGAPVRAITTVGFAKSTPAIVAPPFKKKCFLKDWNHKGDCRSRELLRYSLAVDIQLRLRRVARRKRIWQDVQGTVPIEGGREPPSLLYAIGLYSPRLLHHSFHIVILQVPFHWITSFHWLALPASEPICPKARTPMRELPVRMTYYIR